MKRFSRIWWIAGFTILQVFSLPSTVPRAQEQYRIFVAPIADFALGDEGPTRYEYVTNFLNRGECYGILPTSREDLADFTVWFEFEGKHYVLLWDAYGGNLVYSHGGVRSSGNIVKDVCNAIRGPNIRPPLRPDR